MDCNIDEVITNKITKCIGQFEDQILKGYMIIDIYNIVHAFKPYTKLIQLKSSEYVEYTRKSKIF